MTRANPGSNRYHAEVLRLLIRQTPINSLVTAVAASVIAGQLFFIGALSGWKWGALLIWLFLHLTGSIWHLLRWLRRKDSRSHLTRARFDRIARRAVWGAGFSGILWGSVCLLTIDVLPQDQFVVALVVATLVSGAATTLAALPRVGIAFATGGLVPWIFLFAWQGGSYWALSFLVGVYLIALILSIQRVNGTYRQAIVAQGSQIRLSRHLARLREEWLAVASVTDAVALFDEAGRLVLWNSAMAALMDVPPTQGISFPAFLNLAPWQAEAIAATPPGQWSTDYGLADGRYIQTIVAQKGAWRVLCHRDISPLKARELSLEAERARAVRADRAKSTFLATMSHELRTPLNAIMGFSEVIRDQYVTDPRRISSYAGDIHQSAAHLLAIINDILDIARIENAEIILHRHPIPMLELLDETVRISSGLARRQGVSVLYRGGEDWPLVIGDRTRLAQSICNFLSNAIKASQAGQIVELKARISDEHRYLLTIRDMGPGIPPERLGDLFRPFATFDDRDAYRSAGERGTGLGLAITKELLDAHGIAIAIETRVGTGTAITLDFTPCIELPRDEDLDPDEDQSGEGI